MENVTEQWEHPLDLCTRRSESSSPSCSGIKSANTDVHSEKRKSCKKQNLSEYTEPNISKALEEIRNKTLSIYSAAKNYGIPRTTIQYRLSKEFKNKGTRGPHTVFTAGEEDEIVSWLKDKESKGHPITQSTLQYKVKSFLTAHPRATPFVDDLPGKTWIRLFLRRHPDLSLRTPESVTLASSRVSEKDIRLWFGRVYNYLLDNNLTDILKDPTRILNGDESGFSLNPVPKKVIGSKGNKNVSFVETTCSKTNITVMFSFAADGSFIPPDVILPLKRLNRKIVCSFPSDWGLGTSENGWMDTRNFSLYIKKVLYPALKKKGTKFPVIYFVDGHSSHTALEAADICQELGIILIALFPNATRILQPADVAIFRPLKISWTKIVDEWRSNHPSQGVSLATFGSLLQKAIDESFKTSTIKKGFSTYGLFPFDPDAIEYSKCIAAHAGSESSVNDHQGESADQTGLVLEMSDTPDQNDVGFTVDQDVSILTTNTEISHNTPGLVCVSQDVLNNALDMVGSSKISYLINHEEELTQEDRALLYIYNNILALGSSEACNINESPSDLVEGTGDLSQSLSKQLAMDVLMLPVCDADISMDMSNFEALNHSNDHLPTYTYPSIEEKTESFGVNDSKLPINDQTESKRNDEFVSEPVGAESSINRETESFGVNDSELQISDQTESKRNDGFVSEPVGAESSINHEDTHSKDVNQPLLKIFLSLPKTPKREKKHRNYKQKSYTVLTAAERLEEMNRIEQMKEEAAKLRVENLVRRMKQKLETEEAKKIRQQRIKDRSIQRQEEKIKQMEIKQKKAEEKQIKQEHKRKLKAEMEEKKKIKMLLRKMKMDSKQRRQPLSTISFDGNCDELEITDETESFFDTSEQGGLDSVLSLGMAVGDESLEAASDATSSM